jgi:hypothetical protein
MYDNLVNAFIGVDKALELLRDEVKALRAENMLLKRQLLEKTEEAGHTEAKDA